MRRGIFYLTLITLVIIAVSACSRAGTGPDAGPSPALSKGKALVSERCTACHNLGRVEKARKTAEEWKSTVERMKSKGAKLDESETEAVIEYLAATFKP